MKVVVVRTDGTVYVERLTRPIHQSAGTIVGGNIEMVYPARLKQPYCMICNEIFLWENLPLNRVGCYLYGTDLHGQPICGNIIISKIKGEDLADLTEAETKDIIKAMEHAKLMGDLMWDGRYE